MRRQSGGASLRQQSKAATGLAAGPRHAMQAAMKPTRKFRPRSYVSQVAGGHRGDALTKLAGPSREEYENDHDAPHPAQGRGAAPDQDG